MPWPEGQGLVCMYVCVYVYVCERESVCVCSVEACPSFLPLTREPVDPRTDAHHLTAAPLLHGPTACVFVRVHMAETKRLNACTCQRMCGRASKRERGDGALGYPSAGASLCVRVCVHRHAESRRENFGALIPRGVFVCVHVCVRRWRPQGRVEETASHEALKQQSTPAHLGTGWR